MKEKSTSQSAFFKLRVLLGVVLCFAAITLGLFALGPAVAEQPRTLWGTPPSKIAPWVIEHTDPEAIDDMKHPERSLYACLGAERSEAWLRPQFLVVA